MTALSLQFCKQWKTRSLSWSVHVNTCSRNKMIKRVGPKMMFTMMQAHPCNNNLKNVISMKKEVLIKVAFGPVESILRGQVTCLIFFIFFFSDSKNLDLFVGTRESFVNCPSLF